METITRPSFQLSSSQLTAFREQGFVRLPGMIEPPLLEKLHHLFEEEMNKPVHYEKRAYHENKGSVYITNLEEICSYSNPACLELLGSPFLMSIARHICGEDYFPIQEFAVIKNLGDELPVLWHRDMLHEGKGDCFTIGIYLDDAEENDGALQVIPGSHLDKRDLCEVCAQESIPVPAQAGDVLIHDMMLAHCSGPLRKNKIRRVIYFEFLSAAHVRAESIYTDALVQRRMKVQDIACRYHEALRANDSRILERLQTEIQPLYQEPVRARPSAYCFEKPVR